MTNTDYDLIVLGGGMAGLPVAMKCGYSGMDVALVEGPPRRDVSQSRLHPDEDDAPECRGREPRPPGAKSSVSISTAPSSQT